MREITSKTMKKGNEKEQPGPSGYRQEENDKKSEKSSKKVKLKKEKKQVTVVRDSLRQNHRRRSSSEQPLRYKLSIRAEGYQQSHSVRNLVQKSSQESQDQKKPRSVLPVRFEEEEPSSSDRDHHAAVDFYNRSSPYSYTRESLIDLRGPYKKESRYKLAHSHQKSTLFHRQLHSHTKRCKECLQIDCICSTTLKPPKSDWAVLVQPDLEAPRTWTRMRLDWILNLEDNSPVNQTKVIEDNFNQRSEICCFPFNTFQIFSKRDIKNKDFYMKN